MAINDKALSGKVALVTGASQGIGRAIAVALGRRGAKVIINFLPDAPGQPAAREKDARDAAAEVEAAGGQGAILGFDVANSTSVADAIKALAAEHKQLDILVNNAGIAINGLLMRFTDDQWAKTLQVNLTGAFYTTRAAATLLLKAKESGRIVNISSVVGEMGNGGQAAYSASKAGILGLTMSTARELSSRGVTCNAVAPGYIDTAMTADHLPEAQRVKLLEQIPLGRIGRAEDIADAVAFLAGPEAAYITGQIIRVNGGMLM
ncbi:MAG: short-chain dehydrogenase/reductase [Myxococcales bacterium]|nr:short-chain dehydrogenase/reductase [Myxococcales bacterium]